MSQIPAWFVVVMGIGTVFVGLICIVLICSVLGLFFAKKGQTEQTVQEKSPAPDEAEKGRILAAVSVAIATDSGSDPACVRIISIKKV